MDGEHPDYLQAGLLTVVFYVSDRRDGFDVQTRPDRHPAAKIIMESPAMPIEQGDEEDQPARRADRDVEHYRQQPGL